MDGKARQRFRVGREHLDYGQIEANPYGHLDHHWPQAPYGVHSHFLVEAHGLLGKSRLILGVPFLEGLNPGLHLRHLFGGAYLSQGQRQCGQAYEDSEDNDGYAEVTAGRCIQHHQPVQHRVEYQSVPEQRDEFHKS